MESPSWSSGGAPGKDASSLLKKQSIFFSCLASSYCKSYHTLAVDSGSEKCAGLMDPSCSYSPAQKPVIVMRSSS